MTGDTQPLDTQPEVVLYEEKVKARLAYAVIGAFVGVLCLWTYKAPQMPGESVGLVIGAFITILGGLGQYYWQKRNGKQG